MPTPTVNQRIYAEARSYLGIKEFPGPRTNPEIAKMFRLAPSWLDQDDSVTAWCGIFRGTVGHLTATGVPAQHYRAKEWLNWGVVVNLDDAIEGDTVVFKRAGGYHVALFNRHEDGKVWVLGGNQGNAVSIAPYSRKDVVGVRRFKESK